MSLSPTWACTPAKLFVHVTDERVVHLVVLYESFSFDIGPLHELPEALFVESSWLGLDRP